MSLDERRGRREVRLRLMRALYGVEAGRGALSRRLDDVLELTGADRGALVWIDEYGPGLVHAHCVLDLLSDRPRRRFPVEPLRRAWERGIPGLLDEPDVASASHRILIESPRSLAAVALGSDGLRAWFLVIDSKTPRSRFDPKTADSLMFLAGECASIVIHEDLAASSGEEAIGPDRDRTSLVERERRSRFPGWPVLQDASDPAEESGDRLVTLRFLAARLLRELADDDFAVESEAFSERVDSVRREAREILDPSETGPWDEFFRALQRLDYLDLSGAVVTLALKAEKEGHFHGARELYRLAFDVAVAGAHGEAAVDAARFLGRVNRHIGSWEESRRWYEAGIEVSLAAGLQRRRALAYDGLGNTHRERGAFPDARSAYQKVLKIGEENRDRDLFGRAHHSLALVEKHAGRTDEALRHAWSAVEAFKDPEAFYRALADLGDLLIRCGQLDSAEQALKVVAVSNCGDPSLSSGASELLAYASALRGNAEAFRRHVGDVDLEGVSVAGQSEFHLFRGKSFLALGDRKAARRWFERSLEIAERHGVTRIIFEAEDALRGLRARNENRIFALELPEPTPETMAELRGPLASVGSRVESSSVPG